MAPGAASSDSREISRAAHRALSRAKEFPRSGKRERASGLMARPVWSQRRQARYGGKTILQSYQYSGCSAEEPSREHVGLSGGDDCFLFTAHRRFRACLHRGRPNYWPGHSRGLFECHAGRYWVLRAVTLEISRAAHRALSRAKEFPRSGKRERASGLMARPVWSQRRKARYGGKTILQSYQ